MKNLMVIDTNWPTNTRTQRFQRTLSKRFKVSVAAWRRDQAPLPKNNLYTYRILDTTIGYGNKLKKLMNLYKFINHTLVASKELEPDILFASHWDSLICAALIKKIQKNNIKIIYDCIDLPTSENKFLAKSLHCLEQFLLRYVNVVVLASRYFKPMYDARISTYIYENHPSKQAVDSNDSTPQWLLDNHALLKGSKRNLSWIGVVRYFPILDHILSAIKNTDISFFIFGDGPDLARVKSRVEALQLQDQVIFFGAYETKDLRHIYNVSQLVWAAYPTKDFNAIYAISNKYFECSYFSKRPILSQRTMMADNLNNNNESIIIVDEYDIDDIRSKLERACTQGNKPFTKYEPDILWEDKEEQFIDYLQNHL